MNETYLAQFDGEIWKRWKHSPYSQIHPSEYYILGYGSEQEPHSSLWMAHLSDAVGRHFSEGMTVLDYGCGAARYANFLSGRLKDFAYYGLEPRGSKTDGGTDKNGIEIAIELLGHDPRLHLGYIGSDLECEAIQKADVGILGSIFPHLKIADSLAILDKLLPIVKRGGVIVFTATLAEEYEIKGDPGHHCLQECYRLVYNTKSQFEDYFKARNVHGELLGQQRHIHGLDSTFYRISMS